MVTGYQRQHRKSINYIPSEGADPQTTDQYTRLMTHLCNSEGINEQFSKACELAAVSGMVLAQPYLDYMGDDPAQGALKLKIWEYNSFLVDPYFREPDMSDAQFVWCQEYISKKEAENRFPDKTENIAPMSGTPQRYGSFYFLPENYNMARNDLMVLSYVWYKWKRKRKRLYSKSRNQFFDFSEKNANLDEVLYAIPDMEVVTVDVPTWKLAVVLNDQLMFQGDNPLGFDTCPFIPVFWNYEPHINYYDLRVRSLVKTMRDPQFLMNRKIIIANDIEEATINAGWKRKIGAVGNEDNLKKSGQGWDIIINEGYEMTDVEKILPSSVPASTMQLADQLANLIFSTSGVNLESWAGDDMKQMSGLTLLIKQAANLMVLQKYFDQWDYSLKLLGERMLQIVLNNWNAAKVGLIIGEEPSPYFYSHIFSRYQVIVEEGLNTATQKQQEFIQWMELNQALGGVIPASEIAKRAVIQGKNELIQILAQQEQMQAAQSEHAQMVAQSLEDAKIKELYSKAASNIATARERHGRAEADIGLFEERLSEITHNRAMATKAKMEALEKLVDVIAKYGEIETALKAAQIESYGYQQEANEDREKIDAKQTALSNDFVAQMMQGMGGRAQGQ
jgi:GTP-sensing pleiotropic transcriptional regulator CodY